MPVGPHERVVRDPDDPAGHAGRPADQGLLLEHQRLRAGVGGCQRGDHAAAARTGDHEVDGGVPRRHLMSPSPTQRFEQSALTDATMSKYSGDATRGGTRTHDARRQARSRIRRRASARRRTARATPARSVGLPAGTEVFSADDHISLAEDIFYERFPESMKDQAPRVVYEDGAWNLAIGGKTFLPAGVHRRADAVRPAGRLGHQRPRGPDRASSSPTASTASSPSPTRCSG